MPLWRRRMRRARRRGFLLGAAAGAAGPVTSDSDPEKYAELQRLADLHERGALTSEEFEREKKKLLGA